MSEVKVDKISPKTGTSMTVGDSGDTFTVPSGATLTVAGALNVTGTTSLADGTVNVAELDIDGASDIGAGIADADLFVVDDNAAGANRKTAASRLKTYILADNSLDSDMYVDGSIDLAHMSVNSIDSDQYVDGSIDTAHLADNQVTLAKMAGLARGKIIYGDASGDPAALTVGGAGTALTSNGTDISWGVAGTSWQAVVTGATTMVSGRGYFVNTSSSAYTMTLPASPSIGDFVHIIDYAGTFDTNNCTVGRNSEKILGATSDLVVSTERAAFQLVYVDSTQGWLLTEK